MKKEPLSIKNRIIGGVASGLTFAIVIALFNYYKKEPFSVLQFLIYFFTFGIFMSFIFRYKYTKE